MSAEEPRTNADILRDLLAATKEREWVATYTRCGHGCCGDWSYTCSGCNGHEPNHEKDCRIAALIQEAEAFLRAEEEALERQAPDRTWHDHVLTEAAA